MEQDKKIAYFSMEFGLEDHIKTFSGGLGVLSGDHTKSAADLGLDFISVGLLYDEGYFKQNIKDGKQIETYPKFDPSKIMKKRDEIVDVNLYGHNVKVGAWEHVQEGRNGKVPVIFLTTDIPENNHMDRKITSRLYGGDERMRIAQEVVLGKGGVRMLHEMGIRPDTYHLNEGHGAFATLDLRYLLGDAGKEKTVFTTHTPVPAGHDRFNYALAQEALTSDLPYDIRSLAGENELNMTHLALSLSRHANGVALEHKLVSEGMFPNNEIDHVTNGVHSFTWTHPIMQALFDQYIDNWREDPRFLERASKDIPVESYLQARKQIRNQFFDQIKQRTGETLDPNKITVGFARRFAPYKRADLLFHDMDELQRIVGDDMQFVFAGKAHPRDGAGKELVYRINQISKEVDSPKVIFVPNYSMDTGALLTSGTDIWLNTPTRPKEASGTSGMKAAHNGSPHLSTVDGWWYEVDRNDDKAKGGWDIGPVPTDFKLRDNHVDYEKDSKDLYERLEGEVIPQMKNDKERARIGLEAIENAGFFNTHRMVSDYKDKIY